MDRLKEMEGYEEVEIYTIQSYVAVKWIDNELPF